MSQGWSPDGRRLAFVSQGKDGRSDIYTIGADGGRPDRLTGEPSDERLPSWSADGRWVYFYSNRDGRFGFWRVPASGGAWELMASGPAPGLALESLDGKTLFYSSAWGPLTAKPLDGKPERRVLEFASGYFYAVAEKGIYYWGRSDPERRMIPMMFIDFASGRRTEVARVPIGSEEAMEITSSPDGKTVFYSGPQTPESLFQLMMIENFR